MEVCQQARLDEALKTIPILVSSGMLGDENKKKLRALGVKDFLDKPFRMDDLLLRIDALTQEAPSGFYLT